jgi:hypothetical protein
MQVTLKEVQEFWTRYCERHQLGAEIKAEGLRQIALDHDFWSDHTMQELQEAVVKRLKSN